MEIIINFNKSVLECVNSNGVGLFISELRERLGSFYPLASLTVTAEERRNYIEVKGPIQITDEQIVSTITDEIFNSGDWRA